MNISPILAAAAGNPATEIAHKFGLNGQILFMHVVGFAVVMWALHKWAYQPILQMLDERKARIAKSMSDAEKMRAELANAQAKAQELLREAGVQATKMIEEARAAAAKISEAEAQKAVKAAEQIISKAREASESDRNRMMVELKREIGHLAVKAAMQVTGKMLTADDQQRLAEETNRQLAA